MAYVSKKIEIISSMMGKTLEEIDRIGKNFKDEVFRLPEREINLIPYFNTVKILIDPSFGLTATHYIVGNAPYMFVFRKSKLIAYFDRANLGHVRAIIDRIDRYEVGNYTEQTRRTTYGKITSMLEQTKQFDGANIELIDDLLKRVNKFKEAFDVKKTALAEPETVKAPTLASFEEPENIPVNTALKYIIEIEPTDLDATCKALNSIGINFTLYNKFS